MKDSPKRFRNFATVVYPESAPEGWQDILSEFKVPCFISPLHDLDLNPTGEPKKAHFHVMIMFDGVKTEEQAKEITSSIGGVGLEIVKSIRGYARYLCHLDNPEKAQYLVDDVKSLFGADYTDIIQCPSDRYSIINEILFYVRNSDCDSFADLMDYASENQPTWFRSLCDNSAYIVKEYIKSYSWKKTN